MDEYNTEDGFASQLCCSCCWQYINLLRLETEKDLEQIEEQSTTIFAILFLIWQQGKMSYLFFQTILFCFQSKKDWMQFNESPIHWFMKNDLNKEECIKETNENKNKDFEDNFQEYRWNLWNNPMPTTKEMDDSETEKNVVMMCKVRNMQSLFSFISYCCYFILFCHVLKLLVVSLFSFCY